MRLSQEIHGAGYALLDCPDGGALQVLWERNLLDYGTELFESLRGRADAIPDRGVDRTVLESFFQQGNPEAVEPRRLCLECLSKNC